jgi:hypothetical protein
MVLEQNRKRIVPKLSTILSLVLGATLLVASGCEDEAGKAALRTCNTNLESLQKTSTAQVASVNALKRELAQSQAKVEELTKEVEQLKSPKPTKPAAAASKTASPTKDKKKK